MMMGMEIVSETSVVFNELTRLIARETSFVLVAVKVSRHTVRPINRVSSVYLE
jgi:hypothetical protein